MCPARKNATVFRRWDRPRRDGQLGQKTETTMTFDKHRKREAPKPPVAFDPVEAALRQIFDDVAAEEVPSDFADLVAQLTEKPGKKKAK